LAEPFGRIREAIEEARRTSPSLFRYSSYFRKWHDTMETYMGPMLVELTGRDVCSLGGRRRNGWFFDHGVGGRFAQYRGRTRFCMAGHGGRSSMNWIPCRISQANVPTSPLPHPRVRPAPDPPRPRRICENSAMSSTIGAESGSNPEPYRALSRSEYWRARRSQGWIRSDRFVIRGTFLSMIARSSRKDTPNRGHLTIRCGLTSFAGPNSARLVYRLAT